MKFRGSGFRNSLTHLSTIPNPRSLLWSFLHAIVLIAQALHSHFVKFGMTCFTEIAYPFILRKEKLQPQVFSIVQWYPGRQTENLPYEDRSESRFQSQSDLRLCRYELNWIGRAAGHCRSKDSRSTCIRFKPLLHGSGSGSILATTVTVIDLSLCSAQTSHISET